MATDYSTVIRRSGLRVTRPRLAVLAAVDAHPHAETETVLTTVREELPGVSRQAVYDVLHALTDAGLIRRIQPSGHVWLYETRIADNHHHLVCRVCGDVRDVDCAVGEAPCLQAATDHGFQIDEAEVIYWGVCPDCLAAEDVPGDSGRPDSSAH
ncbi:MULTISPECIES: Fur family transcriptional regulator [Gordonia]|uniref:Ferric uptake regulator n=2 Tax=Gordonia TaxID=2053 RepID=L7LFU5_9ACTN|nr:MULTISPECIES: Fur family transcriptional regulator [Gordonia]AUH68944.1 transcriptional repressor [Gordonia sp. YC-JH1]KJR05569.1 Fur family transcriptional regulator [Gordonia sihwensis]KXT56403.1 Fur family transcriptional regulator [Gordonia sp. QH-12]MBY4570753.1 transcriptional repressor [Gordonia sihwensis]WFN94841.1 Fur family transcriptional regulator [Gordonia sihwensis]